MLVNEHVAIAIVVRSPPTYRPSVRPRTLTLTPTLVAPARRLAVSSVSQYTWTPTLLLGVGEQYTLADCGAIHLGRSVVFDQK